MRPSQVLPAVTGMAVAVDTETSGLFCDDGARLSVVSVAWLDDQGSLVSFAFPFDQGPRDKIPQTVLMFEEDPNLPQEEWEYLLGWLSRQRLIFHNAKFDLHHLRIGTRHWPGRDLEPACMWDTMLAAKDMEPKEPLALKDISVRKGLMGGGERERQDALKEFLKKSKFPSSRYDLAPWDVMSPYATRDAELTVLLWAYQMVQIEAGEGSLARIRHRIEVMRVLYRMERRGLEFDAAACLEAADQLAKRAETLARELPFKPTLPGARNYFFKQQGIIPYKTTEKGTPQLDDEVLRRMIEDGVAHAQEYADYTDLTTALSMWYRGYPEKIGPDGRLRTSFRQTKVKSGRMSVERINLQAVPKNDKGIEGIPTVRTFFQARPGYVLYNLDLSQAELRAAAKYAKCVRMLHMLEAGADLHGITTKQIFSIDEQHPEWKFKRDIAKRLTFGGIFQIGAKTFQATLSKLADIRLPLVECEDYVRSWRGLYPEFGRAYRRADRLVERRRWVRLLPGTPFEERSYFSPMEYTNTGWSRIVQGSLALFLQIWLVEAEAQLARLGVPEGLILTVHDSLVLELPVSEAPEIAQEVAGAGAARATDLFGIEMKVDVSPWHK